MINKIGEEDWDNRVDDIYSSLGEMIVEFETLMHTISRYLTKIFEQHGLTDEFLVRILLSDSTGINLKNYLIATIKHLNRPLDKFPNLKKYLKSIDSKLNEAIQVRNKIIHSAWFYGQSLEAKNEDVVISPRDTIKSAGLVHFHKNMRKEDFDNISINISKLLEVIELIPKVLEDHALIERELIFIKGIEINFDETSYE